RAGGGGEHTSVPAGTLAVRAQRHAAGLGTGAAAPRSPDRSLAAGRVAGRDGQRALLPALPLASAAALRSRARRRRLGGGRARRAALAGPSTPRSRPARTSPG